MNAELHNYDRNGKGVNSCFYESKKIFDCLRKREKVYLKKKTENSEKPKLLIADLLPNGFHKKLIIF